MLHSCEVCDYSTCRKDNYCRHIKSQNHIDKMNKLENLKNTCHSCKFCKKNFKSRQNKWKHENFACSKKPKTSDDSELIFDDESIINSKIDNNNVMLMLLKQSEEKEKRMMKMMEEKEKRIEDLIKEQSHERKEYLDIIKNGAKTTHKSVSAMKHVIENYKKAPPVKKLNDKKAIKMLEYYGTSKLTTEEIIINKFKSCILHEYFGTMIIEEYQKSEKPEDQSFWSSDVARLSFVIVQEMSKGKNEWISDKSGVKIMELIIIPLLCNAKIILKKYIEKCNALNNKYYSSKDDMEISDFRSNVGNRVESMQHALDIIISIDEKSMHDKVLRYICPYFQINIPK